MLCIESDLRARSKELILVESYHEDVPFEQLCGDDV